MQVLLLLKSSDRVMHDICHAFDACPGPPREPVRHALTLRKWIALRPERELRCFVRQHDLVGVLSLMHWDRLSWKQCIFPCQTARSHRSVQTCPGSRNSCSTRWQTDLQRHLLLLRLPLLRCIECDEAGLCRANPGTGKHGLPLLKHIVWLLCSHVTAQCAGALWWVAVPGG